MTTRQEPRPAAAPVDGNAAPPAAPPAVPDTTGKSEAGGAAMRRRKRALAALVVVAVLTGAGGVVAGTVLKSPAQVAAETQAPPADTLTAPVERTVVADTLITRGTVSSAATTEVVAAGGAAGAVRSVVTKVKVKQGESIEPGKVLFEVSGRPVFALPGEIPAYRDLRRGMSGDDVAQLQKALTAVGHPVSSDRTGDFGDGTARAVESYYESIGYHPVRSGDGGAAVGKNNGEKAVGESTSDGASDAPSTTVSTTASASASVSADAGSVVVPVSEVVYLAAAPARAGAVTAKVGSAPTDSLMSVSMGALTVHSEVTARQRTMLRPGQQVEILDEGTGTAVTGTVATVADTPTAAKNAAPDAQGGTPTYRLEITPDRALAPESADKDVRLTVTSASSSGKVLAVPAAALSTGSDGRVSVGVRAGDGTVRRVDVRVGASGGGFVEVSPLAGGRLDAGERVVVGEAPAAANGDRP